MKRYLGWLSLCLFFSCSGNELGNALKAGKLMQQGFYEVLPFEYKRNEIFISVKVNGVPATFMVDTGAPNVITEDFQKRLGLKADFNQKVGDSRNRKSKRGFVLLNDVALGGLNFEETIAAVVDFSKAPEIGCFGVDGFIGANLMRKAYWQIDYQKQTLVITDQYKKLGDLSGGTRIAFETKTQGTPLVSLNIANRVKTKMKLDTGSASELTVNGRYLKKLKGRGYYRVGYTSSGLSGAHRDTTFTLETEEAWIGELQLKKQLFKGDRNASNLIGNQFLEKFLVTIDWLKSEIILIPKQDVKDSSKKTYGFTVRYGKENLIVSGIIGGSEADQKGLEADDVILEINGRDFSALPYEEYCRQAMNNELLPETEEVRIKVRSKASQEEKMMKLKRYELLGTTIE